MSELAVRAGMFAPLRHGTYRLLWIGQSSHAFALWMEQIARPFLVLAIGYGPAEVGIALAWRTAPQLVFGLFAGVISDWFDRRTILVVTKINVLILSIAFAALLISGRLELWHIYAFQFLRGTLMAFEQPARQSMIAQILPPQQVVGGVALMSATQNVMRIVGSAVGGVAIEVIGINNTFVLLAVVYIGAVITTLMLRVATHERPADTSAMAVIPALVEGARYAWGHTTIRAILLMSFVYFTFGMSYTQVFVPLFAKDVMGIGAGGAGFMVSLTGVGALVSALVVASKQPRRVGRALPLIVWTFGAMLVAFAVTSYLPRPLGLIIPFIFITLTGATQTMFFSLSNAAMLSSAPAEMRGRVISLLSLDRGVMSLGGMGAGFLAEVQGVQIAQIVYGGICVVGGLGIALFYKELRTMEIDPDAFEPGHGHGGRHGGAVIAPRPVAVEPVAPPST